MGPFQITSIFTASWHTRITQLY